MFKYDKVHNNEIETSEGKYLNYKLIDRKTEKVIKKNMMK